MSNPPHKSAAPDPWENPDIILIHTEPKYSNLAYVHYADLNEFIRQQAAAGGANCVLLDYGAGSSPYKKYFPEADYRRADITDAPYLRYKIRQDSTVAEADGTFDLILSTQVAEHVSNPDVYFKECFRLLKLGGKLILTTHGIWEEHGSPYDFQRWTDEGIKRDLAAAGFAQPGLFKLTCGVRAALLFFTMALFASPGPEPGFKKFCFKGFRFCYSKIFSGLYRLSDKWFAFERIVPVVPGAASPKFYAVIAVVARK